MRDPLLNPFTDDIFATSSPDSAKGNVEWIHLPALIKLKHSANEALEAAKSGKFGSGRVSLISAPRAGYGKTHLIARLNQLLGDHLHLPLRFDPDGEAGGIQWKSLLESILFDLHTSREEGGDCTSLDGVGRRVFAEATRQMIAESRIPCADPKEAIAALERDPIGLFDFADKDQVVGTWFSQYFEQLLPTASELLARSCGISIRKAKAWITRFFSYTSDTDSAERLDSLMATLPQGDEIAARQSLHELLRLTSTTRPCLMVVDDLDGFYRDKDAGQRLAHLLLEAAKMSPNILLIIAANEDLWEASFGVHIASAYEDRLTSRRIRLPGLSITRANQLVRDRILRAGLSSSEADEFAEYLSLEDFFASPGSSLPYSPRAILRHSANIWERYCAGEPAASQKEDSEDSQPGNDHSPQSKIATTLGAEVADGIESSPTFPDIDFADPVDDPFPTGSEIFDELTRDNINIATKGLLDSNSVTKAPDLPPSSVEDSLDEPIEIDDESDDLSLGVTGFKDDSDSQDNLDELIGHLQPAEPTVGNNGTTDTPEDTTPKPLPSRSSSEDNPFNKLKRMLSKLRSEREDQRSSESETLIGAELKRLDSAESEGGTDIRISASNEVTTPTTSRLQELQDSTVLKEFRRERDLILNTGNSLPIIQSAICALAKTAGNRFPVITLDEPDVSNDSSAVRWSFEDNEILFGNEPGRNTEYWQQLSSFAQDRNKEDKKVKMIVFSSADDPVDVDTILHGKDDLIGIVDFTVLDRGSLASLYAAHRLIENKAVSGSVSSDDEQDILGKLAGELDFFWKRVTRPLPAATKI